MCVLRGGEKWKDKASSYYRGYLGRGKGRYY